jgi:flagellar assembly factor FliW
MELETSRFGTIEIDPEEIITFTNPIIGFDSARRFTLLPSPDTTALSWLQSVEKGDLAFLLINPRQIVADYTVKLMAEELSELAVTSVDELQIFTLLVVPADPTQIRTNLKAPVLINLKQRLGKQTILERSDYPIQFFLAQARASEAERQGEVSNARTDA